MFKVPSALLMRTLAFKAIQHKDGKVTLWSIPATINPNYAFVYAQKLLESEIGRKKMIDFLYTLGKFQGRQAFRMISERFGYAQTLADKKKLLEFEVSQGIVAGHGQWRWKMLNFEKKIFIGEGVSPYADEFRKFFGKQKDAVDHFMRGEACAFIEQVVDEPMFCVETRCIAQGSKFCELMIKPAAAWKGDKNFQSQKADIMPDMKALGAKLEPYIALR